MTKRTLDHGLRAKPRRAAVPTRTLLAERDLQPEETDEPFVRWVQVLKVGVQYTNRYSEPYTLTDEGAAHVVETFAYLTGQGYEFIFDLNHYSAEGGPTPAHEARTGTMLRLDHRAGEGVWALVEFTDEAAEWLRAGKFRFVSPEIWDRVRDPQTGEWIDGPVLEAAALVERPALAGMEKIAARDLPPGVARTLGDRFGLSDVGEVIGAICSRVDALALAGTFGPVETMSEGGDTYQWDVGVERIDPDFSSIRVVNRRTGTVFEADLGEGEDGPTIRNIRAGRLEFVPDPVQTEEQDMRFENHEAAEAAYAALCEQIGITETLTAEAVTAELTALRALREAAGDLTVEDVQTLRDRPAETPDGESVRLMAQQLEERDARIQRLEDRLAKSDAEAAERKAADLVAEYERAGKITPAMRPSMQKIALRDASEFRALADALPVVVNLRAQGTGAAPADQELDGEDLDTHCRRVAKKLCADAGKPEHEHMAFYEKALASVRRTHPDLVAQYAAASPGDRNAIRFPAE